MSKHRNLTALVLLLIVVLPSIAYNEMGQLRYTKYQKVYLVHYTHNLLGGSKADFYPGTVDLGPTGVRTVAPVRQVCGGVTTWQDGQHYTTPGRQIVYAGYYNAACNYVYMDYILRIQIGATLIVEPNFAIYDWGNSQWHGSNCPQVVGPYISFGANIGITPDSGWSVVTFHHGSDVNEPFNTYVRYSNACLPPAFDTHTLAGPPNIEGIATGFCDDNDADAVKSPYVWPKIDVDTNGSGMAVTHVAAYEVAGCDAVSDDTLDVSSLLYYRKVASSVGQPWTGTWQGPYFMDSVYVISQIVRSDLNSDYVYYAYLKPIYYHSHPCQQKGVGHYQITNEVVYKVSENDGETWSEPINVTDYASGFEEGKTEPATYDLSAMVDPNGTFHIVWSSSNRDPGKPCEILYGSKMWHWDNSNDCISVAYDASHPAHYKSTGYNNVFGVGNISVAKHNISWCDDKLYISFTRFGAHPLGDTSFECGLEHDNYIYQNSDIMVVASDVSGGMGINWTNGVNLTNTPSDYCVPGTCESEHWPTMAMYSTDSLMIEYIEDKDPGAYGLNDLGIDIYTDNPVMFMTWPCFAMADVSPVVCYSTTNTVWSRIELSPHGATYMCITPDTATGEVEITNCGNVELNYTSYSDSDWLTIISGGSGTISPGTGPRGTDNPAWTGADPCAFPSTITWQADSRSLANGNYTGKIYIDFDETGDDSLEINIDVVCHGLMWDSLTGGCWNVDVWNTPQIGHAWDTERNYHGNMMFYACGTDSSLHPLYKAALIVGWEEDTTYSDMMGEDFKKYLLPKGPLLITSVGSPVAGQGYWKSSGNWFTPSDSLVHGRVEQIIPGHQDTSVIIEVVSLWSHDGVTLEDLIVGEGIDWDVRTDSFYDEGGIELDINMVYQKGCRGDDSIIAAMMPYSGHDDFIGAAIVDNHDYIYPNDGFDPAVIYNLLDTLDGLFNLSYDSCTDLSSIYRFWEGTLSPDDTLKFCNIKTVSIDGLTQLQRLIDKGIAYILAHNLNGSVHIPPIVPGSVKDNQDGFMQSDGNPIGTFWHELWPEFCEIWNLTDWIDSDENGQLSFCDTIEFTNSSTNQKIWEHVEVVAPTICVTEIGEPDDSLYFDYLYVQGQDPVSPDNITDVIASYWEIMYPEHGIAYNLVAWNDDGNEILNEGDTIWLHSLAGEDSSTTTRYEVKIVSTNIITTRLPTSYKHNLDGYTPDLGDPSGTNWLELHPTCCQIWELMNWIDNADGFLSVCDTIIFRNQETHELIWEHIDFVTPTMIVAKDSDTIYLDMLARKSLIDTIYNPVGTYWHEIYPDFNTRYEIVDWTDNTNGYLDSCDYVMLHALTGPDSCTTDTFHVVGLATDIITSKLPAPIPNIIPGNSKHNIDGYMPNDSTPIGSEWLELHPSYGQNWRLGCWLDNGDSFLSSSDTICLSDPSRNVIWDYIEFVTPTIKAKRVTDFNDSLYIDMLFDNPTIDPITEPTITYWIESNPKNGSVHIITNWIDNGNGYLDSCDYIWLQALSGPDSGIVDQYHIAEDLSTNIITTESEYPYRIGMWRFIPIEWDGWLTVWGTINCIPDSILHPMNSISEDRSEVGIIDYQYNDLLIKYEADNPYGNVDWFKAAIPFYYDTYWQLYSVSAWLDNELEAGDSIFLPSLYDKSRNIQDIYVLADLGQWNADPPTLQGSYDIVDGEHDELPGYLIGTTPIIYDSTVGPGEYPFSTTLFTGTLTWDGYVVFTMQYECQGICGDANNDGTVNVSDAVKIINYVFVNGGEPEPVLACGDANNDCTVNVSDAVKIINYVFIGGDPPGDCCPGGPKWYNGDCCPFVPLKK